MKITLAKTAGFCFGVNRAVNTVYDLLKEGKKVCTLGPIIHNPQLVEELEQKGVRIVNSPSEVEPDETLVIRSHGVEQTVIDCVLQLVAYPAGDAVAEQILDDGEGQVAEHEGQHHNAQLRHAAKIAHGDVLVIDQPV